MPREFPKRIAPVLPDCGKKQRHPISGGEANQFAVCFRHPKRGSASHDLIEFLQQLDLLVHEQLR